MPNLNRALQGGYNSVFEVYQRINSHEHLYREAVRVTPQCFNHILESIKEDIVKSDTQLRKVISAELRLTLTLLYLATGDSIKLIAMFFRVGLSTVREIIYTTCDSIWDRLRHTYLVTPSTEDAWLDIAKGYEQTWNFPNCLGSVDGKHCQIQAPRNSGSIVVLMAMCDAKYRFTYVDVGTPGRFSDGGTFGQSSLNAAMESGQLNIPSPTNLPGTSQPLPFVMVGDEAFPLKPWLMRPFPGRVVDSHGKKIFNYRLSRARRTIENAFGIMTSRWRCLRDNTLVMSPDNAKRVILATCVLHNVMREQNINPYSPPGFADSIAPGGEIVEGIWRRETSAHNRRQTNRNYSQDAAEIRNHFKSYFTGLGAVEWQDAHVRRTQ
ncbi:uncharacterized protein [Watersipora subatra]|uniref:uncharacterized protein n=1 Tax=Watersipora subatra TaxID=2589382 RepID=UPI00355BD22E